MITSSGKLNDPGRVIGALEEGQAVHFSVTHECFYEEGCPVVELEAVFERRGSRIIGIVSDKPLDASGAGNLEQVAVQSGVTPFELGSPLPLETIRIPKPWGAEIWYSGIEKRGVCSAGGVPLPWLIAATGDALLGGPESAPLLLKILDPHPHEVLGDLYFEMHEKKVEVYVVTHIDEGAWPDGLGAIRFGFDEDKVAQYENRAGFSRDYAKSVAAYREIRDAIDEQFAKRRQEAGLRREDVLDPALLDAWHQSLPAEVAEDERRLRENMHSFSSLKPLSVGDVVRVPPFTPHALQHGVRVVEFQTAHYERYILSFAQQVLTQSHWDTDDAIDKVNWDAAFDTTVTRIEETPAACVDNVADFDAFTVTRVRVEAGESIERKLDRYAIVIAIESPALVNGITIGPEEAVLLPALSPSVVVQALPSTHALVLIAEPR